MSFRLNESVIALPDNAMCLLDVVRAHGCYSVKAVCREGDCGACQVIVVRKDSQGTLHFRTFNSCLLPISDIDGCHVITAEGLPLESPVQRALLAAGAIQCGYCTPGFVMALTAWLLNESQPNVTSAMDWLSGNLCRCTGYMGMRRAIEMLIDTCPPLHSSPLQRAVDWGLLPTSYVDRLMHLPAHASTTAPATNAYSTDTPHYGGGTDLAVESSHLWHNAAQTPQRYPAPSWIQTQNHTLMIGAGIDIESLRQSCVVQEKIPGFCEALNFFASRPIRHQATVGGNIAHASPVADLAVMLLALNAQLVLLNKDNIERILPLSRFFIAYKQTALQEHEWINQFVIPLPSKPQQTLKFHFEKVSKRIYQDIASVCVAMSLVTCNKTIEQANIAAGGVAATPCLLDSAASLLIGNSLTTLLFYAAAQQAKSALAPISDVRGSAEYKKVLIKRLTLACGEAFCDTITGVS